jgi:hypothetical protein
VNVPDAASGVGRPDVLAAAAALRWSRPDLTRLLAEHLVEEADARADRNGWLVAAGWWLHAVHGVGDGRVVAADLLEEVRRWDDGALRAPAAGRLRVELAVVAHDAGEPAAAAALLAPGVPERDAELAADHAVAVARCVGAGTGDELVGAEEAWAGVDGPRAALGAAAVRLVAAVTDRRAGRPEQAVVHAVAGLTRLDRARGAVTGATPSGYLAAALAAEWIAALVDAGRWAQARDVIAGLAARLGERTRPTRQLAYLRSTIARVLAADPDADAGEELERAARDAAAADVPDLEHVCRVALGELHEAHGRLEAALESIRLAVLAERRHRARAARLRTALAHLDGLLPRHGATDRDAPDPAGVRDDAATATDEQGPDAPDADAVRRTAVLPAVVPGGPRADPGSSPWATGSWGPAGAPADRRARPATPGRTDPAAGNADDPGTARSRHRRPDLLLATATGADGPSAGAAPGNDTPPAAGAVAGPAPREPAAPEPAAPEGAAREAAGGEAAGRAGVDEDRGARGRWDRTGAAPSGDLDLLLPAGAAVDGPAAADRSDRNPSGSAPGWAGATASAAADRDPVNPARPDPASDRTGPDGAGGAREDAAPVAAGSRPDGAGADPSDDLPSTPDGPAGQRGPAGPELPRTGGSPAPGAGVSPPPVVEPPEVTDPWLAAALAELDRIWSGAPGSAPEVEGCTVVLDLTHGADRLPDDEAAATMRAVAERLDGRLPAGARMRTDSPGALAVVMPGSDRAAASEWMRTAVPDLAESITTGVVTGGTLLRASVHGIDGIMGAQVLQRVGGAAPPTGAGRRTDRFLRPSGGGDQRRATAGSAAVAEGGAEWGGAGRPTVPPVSSDVGSEPSEGPAATPTATAAPVPPAAAAPGPAPTVAAEPCRTGVPAAADAPSAGPAGAAPSASGDADARAAAVRRPPYLPDGVVVRPGSGGRRYRPAAGQVGAPSGDVGGTPGPGADPAAPRSAPTAPGGEPRRGSRPAEPSGAGAGGGSTGTGGGGARFTGPADPGSEARDLERGDAVPSGGTASGAQAPAPPPGRVATTDPVGSAPTSAPPDTAPDQPAPDGLGLADLLAGALAAYRRI